MVKGLSLSAHDIELLGVDMASGKKTFLAHSGRKRKMTKQDKENSRSGSGEHQASATLVLARDRQEDVRQTVDKDESTFPEVPLGANVHSEQSSFKENSELPQGPRLGPYRKNVKKTTSA